jgi:putative ABC transport system permease protein
LETPVAGEAKTDGKAKVEVLVVNARGAPNVTSLEVIRAEDQGFKELDEVTMLMHLNKLQQLVYGKLPPKATSIMLQLRHSDQIEPALTRLTPILSKLFCQPAACRAGLSHSEPIFCADGGDV